MDRKRTFAIAGALVGLACTVQAWTIGRAVVPAQDSIRYLIVAQAMARDGLLTTLRTQREQPLFPALVCLSHTVLQRAGMTDETHWATSLQLAAALPLVLAVVPVYLLFRRLVGPRAALCGGVFFCLAGNLARLVPTDLPTVRTSCSFSWRYGPSPSILCHPVGHGRPGWCWRASSLASRFWRVPKPSSFRPPWRRRWRGVIGHVPVGRRSPRPRLPRLCWPWERSASSRRFLPSVVKRASMGLWFEFWDVKVRSRPCR
ncbi:MAG TPA: hypothetical protein VGX76_14765 [Pirellulales bacterium]|nr:hypothetical protein [Pirellulales bacterium]